MAASKFIGGTILFALGGLIGGVFGGIFGIITWALLMLVIFMAVLVALPIRLFDAYMFDELFFSLLPDIWYLNPDDIIKTTFWICLYAGAILSGLIMGVAMVLAYLQRTE